jgi:hypothetical protein
MTAPGDYVETPRGNLDFIVGPDGEARMLGLLPDNFRHAKLFATYAGNYPTFSAAEIKDRIADREVSAREKFGPDWIKDQDGIGACQGYASASCIERVRNEAGYDRVELSGDFAYALVNGGVDRGSALSSGFKAAAQQGYAPQDVAGMPRWEYRKSRFPRQAFTEAKRFKGFEGYRVNSELELASALVQNFFAVVAVHAGRGYGDADQYGISRGGNGRGNHAVCIDDVEYDTQAGVFKFDQPNSWATRWGDGGRLYLTWQKHLRVTNQYHAFYVFPSTIIDQQGERPPLPQE